MIRTVKRNEIKNQIRTVFIRQQANDNGDSLL